MQHQWYGDRRDLVKWGTLLELARGLGLKHILQVLYFRANEWDPIEVNGKETHISSDVIRHFRNSISVENICRDVSVEVLAEEFCDRQKYLQSAELRICGRKTRPGIIFLDPDTGLEPESGRFGPNTSPRPSFPRFGELYVQEIYLCSICIKTIARERSGRNAKGFSSQVRLAWLKLRLRA
jgi:hypothetical protein